MSFNTLYHPYFEPSQAWLRSMLLFHDTVYTIVPEAANYLPSKALSLILEKDEHALVNISPAENDLHYSWDQYDALRKVLKEFSDEKEQQLAQKAKFEYVGQVPMLDFQGPVKVHYDKMADMLRMDLLALGLAKESNEENWLVVDARVADLILSMLADNIKKHRSEINSTASDHENAFAVTKCCEIDPHYFRRNSTLASSIITTQIPDQIEKLSVNQFMDIRKAYQDEMENFHIAINDLNKCFLDKDFNNSKEFIEEIKNATNKFDLGVKKIKKSEVSKRIRKWGFITLGGIVSISSAALGSPEISIGSAVFSTALQVVQSSQGEPLPGNNITRAQSLLVNIQRKLKWNTSRLGRILSN